MDSLDTLDIPGLSVDANLYNTPWQSIHGFPGYSGHPRIIRGCQPIQYPLGQSIHGFPGYSGHPRTIRGCQPI